VAKSMTRIIDGLQAESPDSGLEPGSRRQRGSASNVVVSYTPMPERSQLLILRYLNWPAYQPRPANALCIRIRTTLFVLHVDLGTLCIFYVCCVSRPPLHGLDEGCPVFPRSLKVWANPEDHDCDIDARKCSPPIELVNQLLTGGSLLG
jgi:hypothetical protein